VRVGDVDGNPQTESLKLVERLTRKDFGHLSLDMTFEDPKVFAKPFSLHMDKVLAADTDILEDVCENEKSGVHLTGGIALPNPASVALHERLGFRKIGHFSEVGFKLGRWVDVGYWELIL